MRSNADTPQFTKLTAAHVHTMQTVFALILSVWSSTRTFVAILLDGTTNAEQSENIVKRVVNFANMIGRG
jgi:hypothetical protein